MLILPLELYKDLPLLCKMRNSNPIEFIKFRSFLNIDITKVNRYIGSGWILYTNKNHNIFFETVTINNNEFIDTLKLGTDLINTYNHINPFYIFDLLNDSGKIFFINYYTNVMNEIILKHEIRIKNYYTKIDTSKYIMDAYIKQINELHKI